MGQVDVGRALWQPGPGSPMRSGRGSPSWRRGGCPAGSSPRRLAFGNFAPAGPSARYSRTMAAWDPSFSKKSRTENPRRAADPHSAKPTFKLPVAGHGHRSVRRTTWRAADERGDRRRDTSHRAYPARPSLDEDAWVTERDRHRGPPVRNVAGTWREPRGRRPASSSVSRQRPLRSVHRGGTGGSHCVPGAHPLRLATLTIASRGSPALVLPAAWPQNE
jgi:hypothetical protein